MNFLNKAFSFNNMAYNLNYSFFGNKAVLIQWPALIDKEILEDILVFKSKIERIGNESIVEVINGYNSILISYSENLNKNNNIFNQLNDIYTSKTSEEKFVSKIYEIPVCYDDDFAPDLEAFASQKELSKLEVIHLHTKADYTVFFIGFLPGFLYLGGLNQKLFLDRKASPKLDVKKGSVGIGGQQTGIYPQDSPGGWHIIGNCPIDLFNVHFTPPCFINAGDTIRFVAIDPKEHTNVRAQVMSGSFNYKILEQHA